MRQKKWLIDKTATLAEALHENFPYSYWLFMLEKRDDQLISRHETRQLAITLSYPYSMHRCGTRKSVYT